MADSGVGPLAGTDRAAIQVAGPSVEAVVHRTSPGTVIAAPVAETVSAEMIDAEATVFGSMPLDRAIAAAPVTVATVTAAAPEKVVALAPVVPRLVEPRSTESIDVVAPVMLETTAAEPAPAAIEALEVAVGVGAVVISAPIDAGGESSLDTVVGADITPPAPAEPARSARALADGYFVQCGAFAVAANAERLGRRLSAAGEISFRTMTTAGGTRLTRVLVGPFQSQADAAAQRQTMIDSGLVSEALIVQN